MKGSTRGIGLSNAHCVTLGFPPGEALHSIREVCIKLRGRGDPGLDGMPTKRNQRARASYFLPSELYLCLFFYELINMANPCNMIFPYAWIFIEGWKVWKNLID